MTAAMLVLEPIFEADLPPEIYAYRAGRNAQQAGLYSRVRLPRFPMTPCSGGKVGGPGLRKPVSNNMRS